LKFYSIDEAFLGLDSLEEHYNLYDFGCHIRSLIKQWTGVPVRIGIAPTKTLTKIALNEAKRIKRTNQSSSNIYNKRNSRSP
jgi:DNA polymerase V